MKSLALLMALAVPCFGAASELKVPPGFTVRNVAGPPRISFPMFATLDGKGRLYVTESSGNDLYKELQDQVRKCRVSLLEDRDGDGQYERATVFADKLTPSMGLVWREGKLYIADPPELVTLEDTDGDGRADKRTVILSGFGHTDNGSLHGLTFGPDGWLYFTTGNPDGYDLRGPDGSRAVGGVGALLRCRADGSAVETVARGFENLVEIVFLPDWSIIGTVTWYQLPERGTRDALVQLLEEGQFPIHPVDTSGAHLQFNAVLPPVALFPAVAHSGLEIYHGGAFPTEMRGNLFSAQHNARKIVRHQLRPRGASYACDTFDFVTTEDPDVHFSDVLEDRDGSLLLIDTGSWYVQHCPTGRIRQAPARGGIYRVSFQNGSSGSAEKTESSTTNWVVELKSTNVNVVAAAARRLGRQRGTNAAPNLIELLGSKEPRVQLAAAEALAHCGSPAAVPAVLQALAGETDAFLEHALTFALYKLASTTALIAALDHPSAKVQSAALLLLDQAPFHAAPAAAVVARLNAVNESLRANARWVLLRHPEWGDAGAEFLRQLVESATLNEADRRLLDQFLPIFATNTAVTLAIAGSLSPAKDAIDENHRAQLLDSLASLDLQEPPAELTKAILECLRDRRTTVALAAIRAAAAWRVASAEEPLAAISLDPGQKVGVRLEAMRELVRRRPVLDSAQWEFLLSRISDPKLPTARLGAAEVISSARLTPLQMRALLNVARGDPVISPGLILDAVERSGLEPEIAMAVLDYLAGSLDAGWTISAERLTKLLAGISEAQRPAADTLLARLSQTVDRQRAQLTEFLPLLNGGNSVSGEKIFYDKGQCMTCHRIWENGGRVGPDLSRVGAIRWGAISWNRCLSPAPALRRAMTH